jgi:hypothetical protein
MDVDKENVGNISYVPAPAGLFVKSIAPAGADRVSLPQLLCQAPPRPVMVGFGCAAANCEHVKRVALVNPSSSELADLRILGTTVQGKNLPDGVRIVFEDSGSSSLKLNPLSTAFISICWKAAPGTALNDSAVVVLNNSVKLPIFLSGVATAGKVNNSTEMKVRFCDYTLTRHNF